MKNKAVVYLLALAAFLIGTIEYIITGIIQMVADDLHVTTSAAGLLVTSLALSAAIGTPIVIALTINIDRRKILSWMLIIFTLSNIITSVSHSFEMVLMTRVLQGISGGTAIVVAMAVATRLVEREKRNSHWHHFNGTQQFLGFRCANRDISKQHDGMESIICSHWIDHAHSADCCVSAHPFYERTRNGDARYAIIDIKR